MTTKTLSGIYTSAYVLGPPITTLSIAATGYLGGGLVTAGIGIYTVVNNGGIYGAGYGVNLMGGGVVTNSGTIGSGAAGIGVFLQYGGVVTNGSGAPTAVISGDYGVVVTGKSGAVTNSATVEAIAMGVFFEGVAGTAANQGLIRAIGTVGMGVYLQAGGAVTNGAITNTGAVIDSLDGIKATGAAATVTNFGTILGRSTTLTAGYGVGLNAGGVVLNGSAQDTAALIDGPTGVVIAGAAATVRNFGTILGRSTTLMATYGTVTVAATYGVLLDAGGVVVNGSTQVNTARIEGPVGVMIAGATGTVTNFGTIVGHSTPWAIELTDTGAVTNGSETDTSALVQGGVLIDFGGTTVNFGTITAGVVFEGAGALTNGSDSDRSALIRGRFGVVGEKVATTVRNFGTIRSGYYQQLLGEGVILVFGGSVVNGDATNTTALIEGLTGVLIDNAFGAVINFGTITDTSLGGGRGVYLADFGGVITNGSAADTTALIRGHVAGAAVQGGVGTITNFGTIRGSVTSGVGATLAAGGRIVNGSGADRTALITGFHGVAVAAGTVINNGTIAGNAAFDSYGLILGPGGAAATNGSTTNAAALITGYFGAGLYAGATLTNFGTVRAVSAGGYAVSLNDATARLNAEAGSVIEGAVAAGGGTVDVVSGTVSMSGLVSNGLVEGLGTLDLAGGASAFSAGTKLTVAQIIEAGAGTIVEISATLADAKVFSQTAGTLSVDGAHRINFSGVGDSFAGTLTGAGTVAFIGGSDLLSGGSVLSAAAMLINTATVTLSGAISLTTTLSLTTAHLIVAAGGATLTGGGTLAFSNTATNKITGATAGATLTNSDKFTGAGQLGAGLMTLINQAAGVIDGNQTAALTIDTGANTIINAGLIENLGTGGTTILSAVANTGSLTVTKGTLAVTGAVSGAGVVKIGGGTADFAGAFSENVTFTSTAGVLELSHSQTYTGSITGFSKTGTTSLDLLDIAFGGSTKASYVGTTTSGTLSVTDGTHTAKFTLIGNYTASTFTPTSDGHGGTTVIDPTKAAASHILRPLQPFIAAMAGFGVHATGHGAVAAYRWSEIQPALAAPRVHLV